jgi:1,4-alpha-glucan branching enzyme
MMYAFNENFCMSLSHDEVVHGKGSLLNKMPGDYWQKAANLRVLFGYMYGQPGKKLIFMGGEIAQWNEWRHDHGLDWHLVETGPFVHYHQGVQQWLADLNRFYANEPALYELDCESGGFEWVDAHDAEHSILVFLRKGATTDSLIVVVCNFTPVPRPNHPVAVPRGGEWRQVLNSDAAIYGGSGTSTVESVEATTPGLHGRPCQINIVLPALSVVFFLSEGTRRPRPLRLRIKEERDRLRRKAAIAANGRRRLPSSVLPPQPVRQMAYGSGQPKHAAMRRRVYGSSAPTKPARKKAAASRRTRS